MKRIVLYYTSGCPNCGGPISEDRLIKRLPCSKCLPIEAVEGIELPQERDELVELIARKLESLSRLRGYWYLRSALGALKEFEEFFVRITGKKLWSAQYTWALRLLQNESIAIVAPTGVGKTTLLSIYGLYRALKHSKVYYLLPTENLVMQVAERLNTFIDRLSYSSRPIIAYYYSSMPRNLKEEEISIIKDNNFNILVSTTGFLSRRWNLLEDKFFDTILVDDVDAVLRNSRNVDRILRLVGFNDEAINIAYRIVKLKIEASLLKAKGRIKRYEDYLLKLKEAEALLAEILGKTQHGQLVIASATGRAYGIKPKVFRELLGFEIGRVHDYTRNVVNIYVQAGGNILTRVVDIVAKLGRGGLIFVSKRYGKQIARKLVELLGREGLRSGLALSGYRVLDRFTRGEYDVLVGMASYYGVIVRGIDLPERIIYTLFVGTPSQKLSLEKALLSPYRLLRIGMDLGIESPEIVKELSKLSLSESTLVRIAIERNEKLVGRLAEITEALRSYYHEVLSTIKKLLENDKRIITSVGIIVKENGTYQLISPDAATYVQASGRASRMLNGSMTLGLSIIVEEDTHLLELLKHKLSRFIDSIDFKSINSIYLDKLVTEAKRSRASGGGRTVRVETSLIIVESPTKAKTIARFFGKPVRRKIGNLIAYETTFYNPRTETVHIASITATRGHIYDLTIDNNGVYGVKIDEQKISPIYSPIRICLSCGAQFSSSNSICPKCGSTNIISKESSIDALRKLALESSTIYIATDPDIEGEKIAYDIYLMLKPFAKSIKRIYLHEITKNELFTALASARGVDKNKVMAQVVRRVEDRWIGFGLSSILWKQYEKTWLGAGRVQTPVLGWIIDRYSKWRENIGYNVLVYIGGDLRLAIHVNKKSDAEKIAKEIMEHGIRVIDKVEETIELNPLPPYTTESLIYDASKLLKYTSSKTMRLAQDLFENGLITYHRTDSTHVSSQGILIAKSYLESSGLSNLFTPRNWGPQGHHEAIRPTMPIDVIQLRKKIATSEIRVSSRLFESHFRLYDLIFRRFIASQMKPSKLVKIKVRLSLASGIYTSIEGYAAKVSDGHIIIASYVKLHPVLAKLRVNDTVYPEKIIIRRGSTIQLYTHGDVVYLMKSKNIGRPSTYSKTIEALVRHGYIIESKFRKYLIPTKLGEEVYKFLSNRYSGLVSEKRTRILYSKLQAIEEGRLEPVSAILELYHELSEIITPVVEEASKTETTTKV